MNAALTVVDRSDCTALRHGRHVDYDWWGCRCPDARENWRLYRKRLRCGQQPPALVPSVGTARRLQGLVAIGYTWSSLAGRLGISTRRVADLGLQRQQTVHRTTAARVAAVFEELCTTPTPCRYARTVAARHGFVPPLSWDNIDDPNTVPERGYSTRPDRLPEVLIGRVLRGAAPIDVLTADEQAELWRRWAAERVAAGLLASLTGFIKQFDVNMRLASHIKTAATGGHSTQMRFPDEASCRTYRKVA